MKKISATFSLTILFFLSYSQDCKYKKNEKDEFTGKTTVETFAKFVRETMKTNIDISVLKIDNNYYLELNYNPQYITSTMISKDNKLMLKLANDSIITLNALSTKTTIVNANKTSSVYPMYSITKEQLEILSKTPIIKVRVELSEKITDHEIKPKFYEFFKEAVRCILLK